MLALSLSSPAPLYLKRLSDSEIMFLIIIYTNSPSDHGPLVESILIRHTT